MRTLSLFSPQCPPVSRRIQIDCDRNDFPRPVHHTLKCHSNHTNLNHFGVRVGPTPAGPVRWPCVDPILGQRRRRWTSIGSTWERRIVPAGWFQAVYQSLCQFRLYFFVCTCIITCCNCSPFVHNVINVCIWYVFQ